MTGVSGYRGGLLSRRGRQALEGVKAKGPVEGDSTGPYCDIVAALIRAYNRDNVRVKGGLCAWYKPDFLLA